MNKPSLLAAAIAAALAASGCNQQPADTKTPAAPAATAQPVVAPPAPAVDLGEAIATVNGKAISKAELASLTEEISARGLAGRVTQTQLVDELIKREVLRQSAEAQHLDRTPETAARLANIQRAVLAHAAGEAYIKANAISDEAVKQEYDRQTAASKATEYKARHILVKTEQEAKDIIKKLQAGGKFEELAKKHSSDPGSASKGGDLGWFSPQQMVGPFSEAVVKLENGKYTTEPVKSDFGWHVILREESRDKAPPPFEAVKEQLRESLQNAAMQKYLAELQAKAQIVRHDTPPPAPAEPAAAAPAQAAPSAPAAPAAETAPAPAPAPAGEAKEPAKPAGAATQPPAPAAEAKPAATAAPSAPAAAQPAVDAHPADETHEHTH